MSKNKITTRQLTLMAMLIALSIILTRMAKIQIGDSLRVEFGNIPILLSGLFFGPVSGIIVGGAADILGANIFGGRFDLPFTFAAMAVGLIGGLFRNFVFLSKKSFIKTLSMTLTSNIIVKIIITTLLLHKLYGQPVSVLLSIRIPLYLAVAMMEALAINRLIRIPVFEHFIKVKEREAGV